MITKAAQEANQHRRSSLRLCFERMFMDTHGGKRSRNDRSGWVGAGMDSTLEGVGEEALKVVGFEDMKRQNVAHTPQ
jgi:hypothetical protein